METFSFSSCVHASVCQMERKKQFTFFVNLFRITNRLVYFTTYSVPFSRCTTLEFIAFNLPCLFFFVSVALAGFLSTHLFPSGQKKTILFIFDRNVAIYKRQILQFLILSNPEFHNNQWQQQQRRQQQRPNACKQLNQIPRRTDRKISIKHEWIQIILGQNSIALYFCRNAKIFRPSDWAMRRNVIDGGTKWGAYIDKLTNLWEFYFRHKFHFLSNWVRQSEHFKPLECRDNFFLFFCTLNANGTHFGACAMHLIST